MKRPSCCAGGMAFFVFELPTRFEATIDKMEVAVRYWQSELYSPFHPVATPVGERRAEMVKYTPPKKLRSVIFRRYRRLPNGTVLDAYDYGLKAWPINLNGKAT